MMVIFTWFTMDGVKRVVIPSGTACCSRNQLYCGRGREGEGRVTEGREEGEGGGGKGMEGEEGERKLREVEEVQRLEIVRGMMMRGRWTVNKIHHCTGYYF